MRNVKLGLAVVAMMALVVGCAITDYGGRPGEQTSGAAKLFGKEVAFSGAGDDSGTYSYVVSYNLKKGDSVKITTLRNNTGTSDASFSRDGIVDRDGDDVQGRSGDTGGTFKKRWEAVDGTPDGACEFSDNLTFGPNPAPIALCITGAVEEIDKDLLLQASFSSLDSLLSQIWSGALSGDFTLEANTVVLGGTAVPIDNFSIGMTTTSLQASRFTVDLGQPGASSLINAILANTQNMVPTTVGVVFDGGLAVNAPHYLTVAFNHDALAAML